MADVVVTEAEISYELRFYSPDNVGPVVDGLYTFSGIPHTVVRIENPNKTQYNQVQITTTTNGVSETSLYEYSFQQSAWTLVSPDGLQVVAQEVAGSSPVSLLIFFPDYQNVTQKRENSRFTPKPFCTTFVRLSGEVAATVLQVKSKRTVKVHDRRLL